MRKALTMDVLATDLADYLVRKGVCECLHRVCRCLTDVFLGRYLSGRLITSQDVQ